MRTKEEIEKLVEDNLKLVGFILIKHFKNFVEETPYIKDDIYQEGCLALVKAAKGFDETKGYKFSTYATWWIKGQMSIFITRYFKKHYTNNLSADIKCSKTDDSEGTLLDTLSSFDEYKNPRIAAAFTRAKHNKTKNMEKILKMYASGYSQKEIAKALGYTSAAIAKKMQEFRREFECIEKLCEITHSIKARYRYDS